MKLVFCMYLDIHRNNKLVKSFQVGKVSGYAQKDSAGVQRFISDCLFQEWDIFREKIDI